MPKNPLTPDIVKKIELTLEERKVKTDRRRAAAPGEKPLPPGVERRSGAERRNSSE